MKFRLGILVCALVALIGCNALGVNVGVTRGSGNVVSENRPVSNFHAVTLTGSGVMNITQGDTESLTIKADDNLMPLITTTVQNGVLTIGFGSQRGEVTLIPTRPIEYALQVKNLDAFELTGAGNINAPALKSESFKLESSGAGTFNLAQLDTKTLKVSSSGAGTMTISGQTETQEVMLSGLGSYNAGDLKSNNATITVSGTGSATVWATEQLIVTISGAGSVSYYGSPQVTQSISGLGAVKKSGDK